MNVKRMLLIITLCLLIGVFIIPLGMKIFQKEEIMINGVYNIDTDAIELDDSEIENILKRCKEGTDSQRELNFCKIYNYLKENNWNLKEVSFAINNEKGWILIYDKKTN